MAVNKIMHGITGSMKKMGGNLGSRKGKMKQMIQNKMAKGAKQIEASESNPQY